MRHAIFRKDHKFTMSTVPDARNTLVAPWSEDPETNIHDGTGFQYFIAEERPVRGGIHITHAQPQGLTVIFAAWWHVGRTVTRTCVATVAGCPVGCFLGTGRSVFVRSEIEPKG
jgi:hypothetical protein